MDWKEIYEIIKEELSPGMAKPRGESAHTICFVYSSHAGNVGIRSFYTCVLIYVINAPIIYLSKKQNTIDSSNFGSEFVVMKIAIYI